MPIDSHSQLLCLDLISIRLETLKARFGALTARDSVRFTRHLRSCTLDLEINGQKEVSRQDSYIGRELNDQTVVRSGVSLRRPAARLGFDLIFSIKREVSAQHRTVRYSQTLSIKAPGLQAHSASIFKSKGEYQPSMYLTARKTNTYPNLKKKPWTRL